MINFYRKIRKKLADDNSFIKYYKYAIGEILLVVIGILLALQVNNWNNERQDYNKLKKYAQSLIQDLEKDIEMINVISYTSEQISLRIDSLSNYIRNKEIEELSNAKILSLTWIQIYRPYMWNRATIEELKNSGSLSLIKNNELSKKIMEYDALTRHMAEDYNTDKVQSDHALNLLSTIVNDNYPNIRELSELFRVSTNYGKLEDVFESKTYQEAEAHNLSFMRDDIIELKMALNSFIRLQFNIGIRTKIELPDLIADAEELIFILKKEYLEAD